MRKKTNTTSTILNYSAKRFIRSTDVESLEKNTFLNSNKDTNRDAVFETESFEGFLIDIIDHLAHDLNFEYKIKPNTGEYGMLDRKSGNWSGLVGQLVERVRK